MHLKISKIRRFNNFAPTPEKNRCGRHQKWNHEEVREAVRLLPLFQRKTVSDLAAALKIPKSTVHLMKMDSDDLVIMPCKSLLKPVLTEQHKLLRVCFCAAKINPTTLMFDDFYQSVHVDKN